METKSKITEIALKIFANEGYASTGVQRICTEAEITKPTMYHYFGNKEGLLQSIYEENFQHLLNRLVACKAYNGDIMLFMRNLVEIYTTFYMERPTFFWLSYHLHRSPKLSKERSIIEKYLEEETLQLHRIFRMLGEYHGQLVDKERFLVLTFLSMVNGCISDTLEKEGSFDEVQMQFITKQFLYGIFSL